MANDRLEDEDWVTEHVGTVCPGCGFKLDASMEPTLKQWKPKGGDITVCLQCGQPFQYQDDLSLKTMTTADIARMDRLQPGIMEEIEKMQQFTIDNQKQRGEEGAN